MPNASKPRKAALALESGQVFIGASFGAEGERAGEVVFNTSMTGYQEILSDPSYKGQIVLMTQPHIGNVGVNPEDRESGKVYCEGFVVRESSPVSSSWRAAGDLPGYLRAAGIPGISGIDTRFLTKHLRDSGALRGVISTTDLDPKSLTEKARRSPEMSGRDLAKEVTSKKSYEWTDPEWRWGGDSKSARPDPEFHVAVMDFGVKENILRSLSSRRCRVSVVPAQTSPQEVLALRPDGVLLSNGPGDPAAVTYAVAAIRGLIRPDPSSGAQIPIFGICLGHQLLALALGGKTHKLKFGHHGANHPVKNLASGKVEITTQNHGFCVDIDSLSGKDVEMTHLNLNDRSLEGLRHRTLPLFSVQYHPESSAGPRDSRYLFDDFLELMRRYKESRAAAKPHRPESVAP